jgi:hypothetical protein
MFYHPYLTHFTEKVKNRGGGLRQCLCRDSCRHVKHQINMRDRKRNAAHVAAHDTTAERREQIPDLNSDRLKLKADAD